MLGSAERVTIDKDNTTIVNGAGDKKILKLELVKLSPKLKLQLLIMIKRNYKKGLLS